MTRVDMLGPPVTFLVRAGIDAGMSMPEILAGTDCMASAPEELRAGLDWPSTTRICDNVHARVGDAGMLDIGRRAFASPLWHYTFRGVGFLGSPGDFYMWGINGPMSRMHPCIEFTGSWPNPDVFEMRMTMRHGYAPSRRFMFLFEGLCRSAVELCGYDPGLVYVEPIPGGHVLGMPSPQRVPLRKRIAQRVRARLSPNARVGVDDIQRELLDKLQVLDAEVEQRKATQIELERQIVERDALAEQVAQTQRLRSVGLLAGGVAHDFNNIIAAILGSAELGLAAIEAEAPSVELIDELRTNFTEIVEASERATRLTRRLLIAGRRQTLEPVALELEAMIADMLPLLAKLAQRAKLELEFVPQPVPAWICADPGQIEQILLNLCVNACDASSAGDTVRIETGTRELDATAAEALAGAAPGRYALLRVVDAGVGMSAEVQARLFDPFFTTKPMGSGTGLGMSVVIGAVEQHGGSIEVDSELGVGTRITIYLPLDGA